MFMEFMCREVWSMSADWRTVKEKKYTEDHEWIELSADGKTGAQSHSFYQTSSPL
jgi:hypothetical protein